MDDIKTPKWLTKEFLEATLESDQKNTKISISNYEMKKAVADGNNYMGDMIRVRIVYSDDNADSKPKKLNNISLVLKVPVESATHNIFNDVGILEREVQVYYELSPKLMQYFYSNGNEDDHLLAKCFKCNVKNIIVLEDLCAKNYKSLDRLEQLDYDHSMLIVKNLAKFHASCARLEEIEPELVEKIGTELLLPKKLEGEYKTAMDSLLGEDYIEMLCSVVEEWPECAPHVSTLRKLKPKIWDYMYDMIIPKPHEFNVLNHGDLWLSNVLFNYDETGKPQKVKFVDFQITRYTNFAIDLITFLYSSVRYEVLKKHNEELFHCYLDNLNDYLQKYGSEKRFEENEIRETILKKEIYSLQICMLYLPYVLADKSDVVNKTEFGNSLGETTIQKKYMKSKKFREVFSKHLEDISKKSWFANI